MRYVVGFIGALALCLAALSVAASIEGCGGPGPPPVPGCDDGDQRCESDAVQLCGNDQWNVVEYCPDSGKTCVESACLAACTAGDIRCSPGDHTRVELCNTDRLWETSETCRGSSCEVTDDIPICTPVTCTSGATLCSYDNTEVWTCRNGDEWVVTATCASNQSCQVVDGGGECITGAPKITQVKWVWADPCIYMTPSDVTITTTATPAGLDYLVSVSDCTGNTGGIDESEVVLTCENETLMAGSVTVTDSENNRDEVSFAFDACIDGRVCADGEPCCNEETLRCSESDPSIIEECAADGSWVLSETCAEGYLCNDDASSAVCRAAECVDGDLRCFESDGWPGTDIEYCLNGTWVFSQSCQQRPDQSRPDWVCVINDNLDPPVYYCG